MSQKIFNVSGRRKNAVARAKIKSGSGNILINSVSLDIIAPEINQLRLKEPLIIAGAVANQVDIDVNVYGGGTTSQAEAARLVIAKAMLAYTKDEKLKKKYLDYDRHLLVADVRRKEARKPNDSKARAKRQKSYR
ncbi:30S ribosomal protein S9 [Candidatus Woesearchaeota archaeon]|nr:30S ribosomal protein S9 [Candidatus Woesearchaeota archaeon]